MKVYELLNESESGTMTIKVTSPSNKKMLTDTLKDKYGYGINFKSTQDIVIVNYDEWDRNELMSFKKDLKKHKLQIVKSQ